tara:strand:+ start:184 stop:1650 length:1467 start_codon:yes stop_codon:yes gene_type:complete
MEVITFDRFEGGIDLRKADQVSDANRLVECKNAYITTGFAVKKRPGLDKLTATSLPSDYKGFFVFAGQAHVVSHLSPSGGPVLSGYGVSTGTTGKVNSAITVHKLTNPDNASDAISMVWDAQVFNNQLYIVVEYASGTIRHWYNDKVITDSNCPNTNSITVVSEKVWAIKDDGTIHYSASGDPTDWTKTSDAGGSAGLPTGRESVGDSEPLALGSYKNRLVVFNSDNTQIWTTDVDPSNISIETTLGSVGSQWPTCIQVVGDDLFFLTDAGFRSIGQQIYTGNLQDTDVGSPIDELVHAKLVASTRVGTTSTLEPGSAFYNGLGQYMCFIDKEIFVFTYARFSKVNAWSRYITPYTIQAISPYGEYMFIRMNDNVYVFNPDSFQDDGATAIPLEVTSSYQAFKKPGRWKQILGSDVMFNGTADLQHRWDARSPSEATTAISLSSDTRPGPLIPVELMTTECSFKVTQSANTEFQFNGISYYYELLGEL